MTAPVIPHSRPVSGPEEADAVARVLASGMHAGGAGDAAVESYERALADLAGVSTGIAVTSGAAALHLALSALGAGPGSRVAVPDWCCAAVVQAVARCGAEPHLLEPEAGGVHPGPTEAAAAAEADCTHAVVVHQLGEPAAVGAFRDAGLRTVEDAAQALGIWGPRLEAGGDGARGDAVVVSSYATKMISTGRGGAVLTDDAAVADGIRDRLDCDERDAVRTDCLNESMPALNAAVGLAQLDRLDGFLARRRDTARAYDEALVDGPAPPLLDPDRPPVEGLQPVHARYVVDAGEAGRRDALVAHLRAAGIEAKSPIWSPLHRASVDDRSHDADHPRATDVHARAVSIPVHPAVSADDRARVIEAVLSFSG